MSAIIQWFRNLIAAWRAWWRWGIDKKFIEDFEETFPGQCVICGLYRAMLREGYQGAPWPHEPCQEKSVRELRP